MPDSPPDAHASGASAAAHDPQESSVAELMEDVVAAVKPRLRGWLHAGSFPIVVVAGMVVA